MSIHAFELASEVKGDIPCIDLEQLHLNLSKKHFLED